MPEAFTRLPHAIIECAAILIAGTAANWVLYGILMLQVYLYAVSFPNDPVLLKSLVYLVTALETAQTAFITHDGYLFFVAQFSNPSSIDNVNNGWFSVPILTAIIACLTQGFYCFRIHKITRSKAILAVIALFSMVQLAGGIAIGIEAKKAKYFSKIFLSPASFIATGIWDAGSAACDLTIAVIMIYLLKKQDGGLERTSDLVSRIIRLTIGTGLATATMALIVMILAFLPGHPPYYQAFALVLGKAYSVSMMVSLNSRIKVVPISSSLSWNETAADRDITRPSDVSHTQWRRERPSGATLDIRIESMG